MHVCICILQIYFSEMKQKQKKNALTKIPSKHFFFKWEKVFYFSLTSDEQTKAEQTQNAIYHCRRTRP